jgi:23S rRNA (uracil1939-C5)-methyltransferase
VGLFSAFLAPHAGLVIGVESATSACEDFVFNLDEFDNVSLYEGEAGLVLPALKLRPDAAVVDPPRAGLEKPALDALVRMRPPLLAYVSCDPATLARDARRLLDGGYQLAQITPFDLFPQTYHIESIALFEFKNE